MRLIFAGTPEFAAVSLRAVIAAGHAVALVLTQPDRPKGRGMKSMASPVAETAAIYGIPLEKPATLKDAATHAALRAVDADAMIVAAYGLLLPQAVLDIPRHGCINVHASLLPRWRGAAPVQRAIEAGDAETGVAIMRMEAGLDTGPILLEKRIAIGPDDTAASLTATLAALGGQALVEALATLPARQAVPQPAEGTTYARKIDKREAAIDWSQPAAAIERRLRAFDPFPGCETTLPDGEKLKVWRARPLSVTSPATPPGAVLAGPSDTLHVACGEGALALELVQRPGGTRQPAAAYLRAHPIAAGSILR